MKITALLSPALSSLGRKRGRRRLAFVRSLPPSLRLVSIALLCLAPALWSQDAKQPSAFSKGLRVVEVYPGTQQIKSYLTSDECLAVPKGASPLKGLRIIACAEDGKTNLIVRAPECLYDPARREASSAGRLQVETGNGQFAIEGEGFLWRGADGVLNISNKVHAILRKDLIGPLATNPPPVRGSRREEAHSPNSELRTPNSEKNQSYLTSAAPAPGDPTNQLVHIYSDEFEFLSDKALFRGHVRADDPQGRITSGLLTVLFTETNRQVQTIRAEQDVVIDFDETHATGDLATYRLLTDTLDLTGKPTWRIGPREGRADELVMDRQTHDLRATGHFYMKMPPGDPGQAGFLLLSTAVSTNKSQAAAKPVEIFADEGSLKSSVTDTNIHTAIARGRVRVLHPEGTMSCALLTMTTAAPSNRVERIVAQENVVLEQGDTRVTSDRAVYAAATGSLEMTGHPAWRMGTREGRAQTLLFDLLRREYRATQDVFMRLPAGALGSAAWLAARGGTNTAAGPRTPEPQPIEISSDEFVFKSETPDPRHDQAIYRGRVQAVDPGRMKLTCSWLTATFLSGTNQVETVVAEEHVDITMLETNAQRRAKGDRAVYTAAQEVLELTGRSGVEITMVDAAGASHATGDKALYHAATDTMELLGNADVRTPWGTMTGPGVWWNRKTGQIKARGLASMTFKSGSTNKASLGLFDSNPFGLKAPQRKK